MSWGEKLPEDALRYAPVLERMVEILGSDSGMCFGEAMEHAASELGIEVPEHMHQPLLVSALRVIASGKIPGCPEA